MTVGPAASAVALGPFVALNDLLTRRAQKLADPVRPGSLVNWCDAAMRFGRRWTARPAAAVGRSQSTVAKEIQGARVEADVHKEIDRSL